MRVDELIIEVRDSTLTRIGQFRPRDLVGATFVLRYNNTGLWQMRLPYGHPLGEQLRLPGYGIVVTGPDDTYIFSGPTTGAVLEQSSDNLQGDWSISGASDDVVFLERLAYPTPNTDDVTAQVVAFDSRQGYAETVLKQYVNVNIGPSAPVARQVPNLTIEEDSFRGELVQAEARFDQMQTLLYDLAQTGGLGYRIQQVNNYLEFQVYEPVDRTATVRMDMENQKLSKTEYSYANAKLTRTIVGGQGEAEWRRFVEVTTLDSEEAEATWGRRIEQFTDDRSSRDTAVLTEAGLKVLVDAGKTIINTSVTPSDDINMRFGIDWFLGDKVAVVINDITASAVVTEIGITIQSDGVRIGATVGTPISQDFESKIIAKQQDSVDRISQLERNVTGYGISIDYSPSFGTDGTQPTWTGSPFSGSFNRFGGMVHFSIQMDFSGLLSFGTGQYYLTLPYASRDEIKLATGCLHDESTGREYQIRAGVLAGSDVLKLWTTALDGQKVYDSPFSYNDPITLATTNSFHIAGTYEIEA